MVPILKGLYSSDKTWPTLTKSNQWGRWDELYLDLRSDLQGQEALEVSQ